MKAKSFRNTATSKTPGRGSTNPPGFHHAPSPTPLYHGGGMNLRVCPRDKINENKNETSRYSGPCQEYAFRRQTLTFSAIFKQRKTAREEAFCALLPVCHFGNVQTTPDSGKDPFLKKCAPSPSSQSSLFFWTFFSLTFFSALYPAVLAERLEKAADLLSIGRHISHTTNENKLILK